jgi:hypothetical protein
MPPRRFGLGRGYRWVVDYPPSPNQYETIVRARKVPIGVRKPPYGARELTRLRNIQYGRRIMREHRTDLLARADPARRLRQLSADGSGTSGASRALDFLAKIRSTGRTHFQVPYKQPGMLGPIPQGSPLMGRKVLELVSQQKEIQRRLVGKTRRLGSCWTTTVDRMKGGWKSAYGSDLLAGHTRGQTLIFQAIAGSRKRGDPWTGFDWSKYWKAVPKHLRYRGVPGALSYLGIADVVEGDAVWRGKISPGAPLQFWWNPAKSLGHSAVMERYIRDKKGKIIGLVYSDQWLDYHVLLRSSGERVIGARFKRQKP